MATVTSPSSQDRRLPVARSGRSGNGSLGEMLRRAREHRGFTLERIARETKIPQRHLEALEHDNLTAIPSGFYRRAELRTCAQAIGLDQGLALAELESALTPVETQEPARKSRQTQGSGFTLRFMAIVLAAGCGDGRIVGARDGRTPRRLCNVFDTPVAADPAPTPVSPAPDTVKPELQASDAGPQAATEAATAPAPAQSVTELVVTTQPAGARVHGRTASGGASRRPGFGTSIPGERRIRVSKEGYVTAGNESLRGVAEGRGQALDIQLEAAPVSRVRHDIPRERRRTVNPVNSTVTPMSAAMLMAGPRMLGVPAV